MMLSLMRQEVGCCVGLYSLRSYFCVPGPRLRVSTCVPGPLWLWLPNVCQELCGLPCEHLPSEHLLCDYLLPARLVGFCY